MARSDEERRATESGKITIDRGISDAYMYHTTPIHSAIRSHAIVVMSGIGEMAILTAMNANVMNIPMQKL
jgi:hypothetical protein